MQRVDEIFEICYGNSLELNSLDLDSEGIPFVSRTAFNNGVSAKVKIVHNIAPLSSGTITVSLGGSVLEAFLQPQPFYTGYHVFCLTSVKKLSEQQKLYYCACIRANKYKYSYGRQANKTLKSILIPSLNEIPVWVDKANLNQLDGVDKSVTNKNYQLSDTAKWEWFELQELFDIERGKGPRKQDLDGSGSIPVVTSTDKNNGWTGVTKHKAIHPGNTIGVNRNGSVGEVFYQPLSFCSTEDVHVLYPKFKLNKYSGMFISTIIRQEKYRFSYGRKWGLARMKQSKIKLPIDKTGTPDWKYMEGYIKSLPYSVSL